MINRIAVVLLLLASMSVSAWQPGVVYRLTILHTNDHHGRFWPNKQGENGLPAQKTLVDRIRQQVADEGGSMLLLSAGDTSNGTAESDLFYAEPDFRGMKFMRYDAMALGNHEFTRGLAILAKQQEWAEFPFLSANTYRKSDGQRLFQPYHLIEKQGLKIAIIGLTTQDTALFVQPAMVADLQFRDPIAETKKAIAELRQAVRPDIILLLSHLGYYDNGVNSSTSSVNDVQLARALSADDVSMIIGGHTHSTLCMDEEHQKKVNYVPGTTCRPDRQNGIWIVQANEWGKYVGRADITFQDGKLTLDKYTLIPVNLKRQDRAADGSLQWVNYAEEIPQDAKMVELLQPFWDKAQQQLHSIIGTVDGKFTGKGRGGEKNPMCWQQTDLGRLILLSVIEGTGADIALLNCAAVKATLGPGEINNKDILELFPFKNDIVVVELSGSELLKYLNTVANYSSGSRLYAQKINLQYRTDDKTLSEVKIKGEPLQPDKCYRLAITDFLANGGDGYPDFRNHAGYSSSGKSIIELLMEHIKTHSPLRIEDYQP